MMMSLRSARGAVLLVILLLALAMSSTALAQETESDGAPVEPDIVGDPAMYPDPPEDNDGEVTASEADIILAQPPYTLNYQGYLTDGDGNPLSGTHEFSVSLWDAETGGNNEWGVEVHDNVPVDRGLFNLVLGSINPLSPDVFGEALFLQIIVDGVTLPRQPLRPSAYAFGLVPGAEVDGVPVSSNYGFSVVNRSTEDNSYGIYARGRKYGIYAEETGLGEDGIYTPDYVNAKAYRSQSDSWYYTAGMEGEFFSLSTGVEERNHYSGYAQLRTTDMSAHSAAFYIPIRIPAVLYGRPVTVEQIRVHYRSTHADTRITSTRLYKQIDYGQSADTLINDSTTRNSATFTAYTLTPGAATNNVLSDIDGILIVRLGVLLQPGQTLYISSVGVRLGHME